MFVLRMAPSAIYAGQRSQDAAVVKPHVGMVHVDADAAPLCWAGRS
jgi:hypothetical protein